MGGDSIHIDEEQIINSSICYLKEEAAAFPLFLEFNCEYEIYYNKRTAVMQYVYDNFVAPVCPDLLQLITLRFKN